MQFYRAPVDTASHREIVDRTIVIEQRNENPHTKFLERPLGLEGRSAKIFTDEIFVERYGWMDCGRLRTALFELHQTPLTVALVQIYKNVRILDRTHCGKCA